MMKNAMRRKETDYYGEEKNYLMWNEKQRGDIHENNSRKVIRCQNDIQESITPFWQTHGV